MPLKCRVVLEKKEEGHRDRRFPLCGWEWGIGGSGRGCERRPPSLTPEPLKLAQVGTSGERSLLLGLRLPAMTLAVGLCRVLLATVPMG